MALTAEALEAFYAAAADPDAAATALAGVLGIEAHTTDSRGAAKLDFVSNTLSFARDAGFSEAQTMVLHDLVLKLLELAGQGVDFAAAEGAFQSLLVSKVTATPTEGCFTIDDVKAVSEYFANGFFAHFKLYSFMYTEEQRVDQHKQVLFVETPFPFAPLVASLMADAYEAKVVAEAEAAAAAAKAAAEAAEAAAEEAKRVAIEAEDARKKAEEEELAKRKPKTLDEAVEHAVRMKLSLEKAALEAQYAAREAQLLQKIAVLEQQMGTA